MTITYKEIETPVGDMIVGIAEDKCVIMDFIHRKSLKTLISKRENKFGPLKNGEHHLINKIQKQLDEYFKGKRKKFTIPIETVGTPFMKSVWQQLQNIPYGETRSYGDIAESLGKSSGAARSVGWANGQNCIAIIIPCHRVIGADGSLIGYGGGIKTKKKLLKLESDGVNQTTLDSYLSVTNE